MEQKIKKFNVDRFNLEKIRLGTQPVSLTRKEYKEPMVINSYLVNDNGQRTGTKGDMYQKIIMDRILQEGCLDHNPRPYYIDTYKDAKYDPIHHTITDFKGNTIQLYEKDNVIVHENEVEVRVPAHTISLNTGIECTYDLSKGESPLITLRPIAINASIAEILWIYQKESNDLVVFDELRGKNTWDINGQINNWWKDWAITDEDGKYILNKDGHPTIGACYGETVRRRHILKEEVINAIKNNPDGRRNISCMWQQDDFKEKHGLKPCAFMTIWNVRHDWDGKDYLDMTLVQRSSDFATAGCINQVQYASLLIMVARELGLNPGKFTWKPINIQLYDRHLNQAIEILNREPISCKAEIKLNEKVNTFEDVKPEDIMIEDYPRELIKTKNPQLRFPLGI